MPAGDPTEKLDPVGFVGVGIMGHGMASCLLKAGYPLNVIANRNRQPVNDLVSKGANESESYTQLAEESSMIVLCVSSSAVVESVVGKLTPHLSASQTIIDTGTSSPDSTREIAERLSKLGIDFVEAPVTGGKLQAAAGELGALVGATETAFEKSQPLLSTFCKQVHHFGAPGAGNTAKLINNYMVTGIVALITEAFTKADTANIDWSKLYDVVTCGSADSGALRRIIGNANEENFKGYAFDVQSALKDIRYFCDMAEQFGGVSPLAASVRDVYEEAVSAGHGERLVSELLAPGVRNS